MSRQLTIARTMALPTEYVEVLRRIDQLTRAHGLVYDLSIGALILEFFFGGNAQEYYSRDHSKETVFYDFVGVCRDELAAQGQSESKLRNCVRAYLVYRGLPQQAKDTLLFSHLVELARCRDTTLRNRLAFAAIEADWTVSQLREAVSRTRSPQPEPQDPVPPDPELGKPRTLSAARLVSKGEKLVPQFAAWIDHWAKADPSKLSKRQRERLDASVAALELQLAALRGRLNP